MSLLGGSISITGVTFMLFCVFAIAVIGYGLGRISIKGVNLGTAGVFIVALLFGCFFFPELEEQLMVKGSEESVAYVDNALKVIESFGLILFVTAVGFIAGPKFFGNLKKNFKSYILLGVVIILAGGLAALGCIYLGRVIEPNKDTAELTAMVVGLLSGSLTSTPAFSAAKDTVVGKACVDAVSVGHGIAYIFGVVGVVLFVQLVPKFMKANMEEERAKIAQIDDGSKKEYTGKLIDIDDFGFAAFSFAAILGTLVGLFVVPGTTFKLTTTGGCLMVALVLGHFGRIGKLNIMPKEQTLKIFRELGLMLFLIGAGIPGGAEFVEMFKPMYFVYGVIMTVVPLIIGFFVAKYIVKLSLLNNLGSITGGMTSTPALGTLIATAGTEEVASAYAATYPIALIAVVLVSQFLIMFFS